MSGAWNSLHALNRRLVVGLMSGTSADGVDGALVEITGAGADLSLDLLAWRTDHFPREERRRIHSLFDGNVADICEMNVLLAERFAEAALRVIAQAGLSPSDVHLIGSHGQTVFHIPRRGSQTPSSLQIGEPAVIAERTGITTVANFRPRDIAAGGEGAPLVPYADWVLFRKPGQVRCLLNIGGIANVTIVTPDLDDVVAFDTGPGNMVIDAAMVWATNGKDTYDESGAIAAEARHDDSLLNRLLDDAYLEQQPPKSTGREKFGQIFFDGVIEGLDATDSRTVVSTMTSFVAQSIAQALQRFVSPKYDITEVVVTGGGASNLELVRRLGAAAHPLPVHHGDVLGIPPEAKEAISFAVLANETVCGQPSNVPGATGADGPRVLGAIVPGRS